MNTQISQFNSITTNQGLGLHIKFWHMAGITCEVVVGRGGGEK